jgi:hypothetical protein
MLTLNRSEGQLTEVTHRSGDRMRFWVRAITGGDPGRVRLVFEDEARNFEIQRPERGHRPEGDR